MAGGGLFSLLPQAAGALSLGATQIALDETQRHFGRNAQKDNQQLRVEQARTQAAQDEQQRQQELSRMLARQRALMGAQGVQASGSAVQGMDMLTASNRPRPVSRSLLNLNNQDADSAWLRTAFRLTENFQ